MNDHAVIVDRLTRRFADRDVLRDVSFTIRSGAVLTLVGANGSGKTTLLEILATLLLPTGGRGTVFGLDLVSQAAAVRRTIGYCPSSLQTFYPRLTGRRNLAFFAALAGLGGRRGRSRIEWLLERVGLAESAGVRVEKYSDGMKARLAIARALLADPPLLLLDEPTKSLDPEGKTCMRELLLGGRSQERQPTVVWVTHDREEAAQLPGRMVALEDGRLNEIRQDERMRPDLRAVAVG